MTGPLIHIGYHKTGTSWLQELVFSDASLGFHQAQPRSISEAAFVFVNPFEFDPREASAHFAKALSEAASQVLVPVISHERLSGHTSGIDSRMIADRIAGAFPDARILIGIREQRDMMLSFYKDQIRFGTETIAEMWPEATLRERRRPGGRNLEHFEYHRSIAYYQTLFGADRVLVLPYELLKRDPLAFVTKITSFVELPRPSAVPIERVNVSLPSGLLAVTRQFNKVVRLFGLSQRLEGPIHERPMKRAQLRLLRPVGPLLPQSLSRAVERRWREAIDEIAGDRFAVSNAITARLTDIDLASFGYMVRSDSAPGVQPSNAAERHE